MSNQRTFMWDGVAVPWISDTDEWTAAELRDVEHLAHGEMANLSMTSVRGFMICVSVARAAKLRIAAVDAQLTFGRIRAIAEEMDAQDKEAAARAAADAETSGNQVDLTGAMTIPVAVSGPPEAGEVLSPTSAGSEQQPA